MKTPFVVHLLSHLLAVLFRLSSLPLFLFAFFLSFLFFSLVLSLPSSRYYNSSLEGKTFAQIIAVQDSTGCVSILNALLGWSNIPMALFNLIGVLTMFLLLVLHGLSKGFTVSTVGSLLFATFISTAGLIFTYSNMKKYRLSVEEVAATILNKDSSVTAATLGAVELQVSISQEVSDEREMPRERARAHEFVFVHDPKSPMWRRAASKMLPAALLIVLIMLFQYGTAGLGTCNDLSREIGLIFSKQAESLPPSIASLAYLEIVILVVVCVWLLQPAAMTAQA